MDSEQAKPPERPAGAPLIWKITDQRLGVVYYADFLDPTLYVDADIRPEVVRASWPGGASPKLHEYPPAEPVTDNPRLTPAEKAVMLSLGRAWTEFQRLDDRHPSDDGEFVTALHTLQCLIAFRVARRVDPDWWSEARR